MTEKTSPKLEWTELDKRAVDTVRVLAMDAVEKVGNGHPGTAMSLAPAAYLLFQKVMRHNPADPHWAGRDRFVLSAGHSSLTLYIQLYLAGFGLELDDLKSLRTWGSQTPGHPEHGHTPGVETTTGPLGQGVGNAVGMAMAARRERGLLDPEAARRRGPVRPPHLRDRLATATSRRVSPARPPRWPVTSSSATSTMIYDANKISIEDDTNIAFSEDVAARYAAYGWHVQDVDWTNGGTATRRTSRPCTTRIEAASAVTDQPSFIRAAHDHRLAGPEQAEHRQDPRLRARRRRGRRHQEGPRLGPGEDLRRRRRGARAHPRGARPRQGARRPSWRRATTPGARPTPSAPALLDRLRQA